MAHRVCVMFYVRCKSWLGRFIVLPEAVIRLNVAVAVECTKCSIAAAALAVINAFTSMLVWWMRVLYW